MSTTTNNTTPTTTTPQTNTKSKTTKLPFFSKHSNLSDAALRAMQTEEDDSRQRQRQQQQQSSFNNNNNGPANNSGGNKPQSVTEESERSHSLMYSEDTLSKASPGRLSSSGHHVVKSTVSSFSTILKVLEDAPNEGSFSDRKDGTTMLLSNDLGTGLVRSDLPGGEFGEVVVASSSSSPREAPVPPPPAPVAAPPSPPRKDAGSDGTAAISITSSGFDDSQSSLMKREEESFYSAPDNDQGDDNIWGLLSGVGGNIYEWYDFAVYGLLASEIGACFFPKSSKELQLINSFGVYLAAFLMRPLGAILFGEMGDRVVGRKNALVLSIMLITLPSVAMGLLPTYEMIGPTAPILLVVLRMLQGLSVGGQLAGSYVLSIEQSTSSNRGFRGSICDASSVGGFLLATAVTTAVRQAFSQEIVSNWGWRIPFWFSLLIAPLLYHIVKHTEESKFWSERNEQKGVEKIIREEQHLEQTPAFLDLLSSPFRRRQLAGMIGVMSTVTSSFYMLFLWTPIYLADLRGLVSQKQADFVTFWVVGVYICILICAGRISDLFPHRSDLIKIGLTGIVFACPTMFGMFESESIFGFFLAQFQYSICLACVQGGLAAWEVELWMADPSLSFTGVAIGHNTSATVFGGTMPLIATYLFYSSENICRDDDDLYCRLIPGLYISCLALLSLYCISYVIRHPHDVRTGEKQVRNALSLERKMKRKERKKKRKEVEALSEVEGTWMSPNNTFGVMSGEEQRNGSYVPPAT